MTGDGPAHIVAVALSAAHTMTKARRERITLLQGLGVEGDAHAGERVRHRSRARRDPDAPNLRQVHLLHAELHDELRERGFDLAPGEMGENVTTRGIDLLGLGRGTRLCLGDEAVVEVTGLRNPCVQLDRLRPGLMGATLERAKDGDLVRKAGVMAVVVHGGVVVPGDAVHVVSAPSHEPLRAV